MCPEEPGPSRRMSNSQSWACVALVTFADAVEGEQMVQYFVGLAVVVWQCMKRCERR
jgi:hypothetical protein